MKRITFICLLATLFCVVASAKERIVTERDSLGNVKRIIEVRDTVVNGETMTDTLSVITYESPALAKSETMEYDEENNRTDTDYDWNVGDRLTKTIIAILGIVFVFGSPAIIVFLFFYFRHKNRKAKYRLAEQALACGQPLPEEFFKGVNHTPEDNLTKGIKNIFLGIGLFIFLWSLTTFSLGSIGLLIMFIGFGQVVIHYVQQGNRPNIHVDRDTRTGRTHVRFGNIEVSNQEKKD